MGAKIEVGNGKVIDGGTVLVRGGKIAEVGKNVNVPSGVTTVDAKGMFLYPGFIDAYTTKGLKLPDAPTPESPPSITASAPPTMWQGNRKGIRAQVSAADCLDLASRLKEAHAAGLTAALFAPGGTTIRGAGAFEYWTDEKVPAKPFGMDMSFRGGGGGGGPQGGPPGGGSGYPSTLMGVVALIRQTFYDAQTYAQTSGAKKDADYDALQPLLKGATPAIFDVDSELDIVRALNLAKEFNFPVIVQSGRDAFKRASMLASQKVPVLLDMSIGDEPSVKTTPDGPPAPVLEERRQNWKDRSQNAVKLNDAGVLFAFSSEGDGFDTYLASVRKLVGTGLPKAAALKAMTISPAQIFGVEKDLGTVETGKVANLVLMDGDLFSDKAKVKKTIVMGKVFEVESK